jgi:sedoheptulokinase
MDAGTTSVSGVLLNTDTGGIEETVSREHEAALPAEDSEVDIQDPGKILDSIEAIKGQLVQKAERLAGRGGGKAAVAGISLTGQVHGILYIDQDGHHVSPLYTWQDTRGRRARASITGGHTESWSAWAGRESGYVLPPGYGFLTHLINEHEGMVPADAVGMTSILGYLSMRLTGSHRPQIETTDAHPLGLYQLQERRFDSAALRKLNIPEAFVPEIVPAGTVLGTTDDGIDVFAAVGDNQTGYVGAVREPQGQRLISIGTSGQLSVHSPELPRSGQAGDYGWTGQLEVRPFPGGEFLLAGASIAGGSSYRLLETFFREICRKYAGGDPGSLFEQMNSIPYDGLDDSLKLDISTQFLGTRRDPSARGSIRGIGRANFTPDYLVEGFLRGIVGELMTYFNDLPGELRERSREIIGVGNALRRNPLLRRMLQEQFDLPLRSPAYREEAALGAAIIAAVGAGAYESYTSTDRPIPYEAD